MESYLLVAIATQRIQPTFSFGMYCQNLKTKSWCEMFVVYLQQGILESKPCIALPPTQQSWDTSSFGLKSNDHTV